MCNTPVIHMFHKCNTVAYPTHILHMWNYMSNTGVYPTHVYNMCITHVYATYVIHLYFYIYNTLKKPHMYNNRWGTIGQ